MGGFGNTLFQITHGLAIYCATKRAVTMVSNLTERNIITKNLKWTIHEPIYQQFIEASSLPVGIERVGLLDSLYILAKAFLSRYTNRAVGSTCYSNTSDLQIIRREFKDYVGYFQGSDCNDFYMEAFEMVTSELYRQFIVQNEYKVVVHFRWGDSHQAKKTHRYYEEIRRMLNGLGECLIVTDSVNEANVFFGELDNCRVFQGDAISDFGVLVSAEVLFCAPSTFSWWAGQASKGKEVYMPLEYNDFTFINRDRFIYV